MCNQYIIISIAEMRLNIMVNFSSKKNKRILSSVIIVVLILAMVVTGVLSFM